MTLHEIVQKFGMLEISQQREKTDQYAEFVIFNKDIQGWNDLFADVLGPAVKPEGAKPRKDDLKITKDYGGIYSGQTLFKKGFGDQTIIAMFWPWGDRKHTTLKIAVLANKETLKNT